MGDATTGRGVAVRTQPGTWDTTRDITWNRTTGVRNTLEVQDEDHVTGWLEVEREMLDNTQNTPLSQ